MEAHSAAANLPTAEETAWFSARLLHWYEHHGRKDLPWQQHPSPYHVWVSEIMLQQTQVNTVIPYYERFIARFPGPDALAAAPLDEVLRHWAGLGYYARARNLHKAALLIRDRHGGCLPLEQQALEALPGIGRSTAAAILALAAGRRAAILDGNVKRVLARYHAVPGWPGQAEVNRRLWALAERHTPARGIAAYTQAIMDLGAMVCTRSRPVCDACPVAARCRARATDAVHRYPHPRPRRTLPLRHTTVLILQNDRHEILLERRPPSGIWGGLWSLPEYAAPGTASGDEGDIAAWCREILGCEVEIQGMRPPMRHTFTHFHLDIRPLQARVLRCVSSVMEAERRVWYNARQIQRQALAAPIRRLLQSLFTIHERF